MHRADKRAETAALIGLVLQIVFFGLFLILSRVNNSAATLAEGWHLLAGVGIWILIFVEVYQRRAAWEQRTELDELERQRLQRLGGSESVFQAAGADEELPAERRLRVVQRWFVPIFSILTAGLLAILAVQLVPAWKSLVMTWMTDALATRVGNQFSTLAVIAVATLGCFVVSRYCLGLSRTPEWRVLRAGGTFIMGNALVSFALAITLALTIYGVTLPERILARIIPGIMLVLAVEIILNLILDIYRPRIPGAVHRPCYESRLLGLFSEPEGVLHSIAQTIDYQFGFKVSETWFYRLLQEAIAPLLLFGAVTLYLLSAIVIVQPGEQAVVTHFGQKPAHTLSAGLHLKWPWPVDKATVYDTGRVMQMIIGFSGESAWMDPTQKAPILWTVKHVTGNEFQFLVASKKLPKVAENPVGMTGVPLSQPAEQKNQAEPSPVNILAGDLVLYYRIKDLKDGKGVLEYLENYLDPDGPTGAQQPILESVAYRQWTQYMASVDPMAVMTTDRDRTTEALKTGIQEELDRRHSGLEIIRVCMIGMHPPVDIAGAYESAINARQERETLVWKAREDANKRLPAAEAVRAETLGKAWGEQYGKLVVEKAKAERFDAQLQSYTLAPDVFYLRNYLDVLLDSTANVRKFIFAVEHPEKMKVIIDNKENLPGGMLDLAAGAAQDAKQSQ